MNGPETLRPLSDHLNVQVGFGLQNIDLVRHTKRHQTLVWSWVSQSGVYTMEILARQPRFSIACCTTARSLPPVEPAAARVQARIHTGSGHEGTAGEISGTPFLVSRF